MPSSSDANASADASDGAKRACANLRKFPECVKESPAGRCEERVDLIVGDKLTSPPYDVNCVANALNVEVIRKCPTIKCDTVQK
jgi:hypothetical protein